MAHIEAMFGKGCLIEANPDAPGTDCFDRISELATQFDEWKYPNNNGTKMHKVIKSSANRCKFVCYHNNTNTMEHERVCTFKIVSASRDGNRTAKISKNSTLRHSCEVDKNFATIAQRPPVVVEHPVGETRYTLNKKRKAMELNDNFQEAWLIISVAKQFKTENFPKAAAYLEGIGIYEAADLKDLDEEHINLLSSYLKEIPRKKWLRLLVGSRPN